MSRRVFVTGTDTNVGKTVVSALLLVAARLCRPAFSVRIWKPWQTGSPPDDDAATVQALVGVPRASVHPSVLVLPAPVSPLEAARLAGVPVPIPEVAPCPPDGGFLVVEGAGGLLVPLDAHTTIADAVERWGMPVVLVARPDVGTINHTALSVREIRGRGLPLAGLVFSGEPTEAVRTYLASLVAPAPVVALPRLAPLDAGTLERAAVRLLAEGPLLALLDAIEVAGEGPARVSLPPPAPPPSPGPSASLVARDAACVWHPYTQHGLGRPPLPVVAAEGATLVLGDGRRVLDGISSWWTSLVGHGHPAIVDAIGRQARALDHVQFGGATHEPAVALAERLVALAPAGLSRVFYSDDGSTAVETALKMALAAHVRRGGGGRDRFVALEQGYHGDTSGAMSVSEDGPFTRPFAALRVPVLRLPPPVRGTSMEACLAAAEALFAREGDRVAAIVVEPLLQGAAGMRTYPPAYLRRLRELATAHGTFLIADEVLTGFGRTGTRFACEQAGVTPDLLCCSKALTGGTLPLAATLATEAIYGAFLSRDPGDAFLHGHSYTGNPIACAAALAALSLLDDAALARARAIGDRLGRGLAPLAGRPGVLDVRGIGLVRAVELGDPEGRGYLAETGRRMADVALEHGVLLRPLGPVLYALPPLCVTDAQVDAIAAALRAAVESVLPG